MKLPEVTPRARRLALVLVLITQSLMFGFFARRGPEILADNVRYEEGGWSLASGRGIALPYAMSPDRDVRSWVCDRHPDACADGYYPSALYPAGYQVFIGVLYKLTGRSLWAILLAQLVMLWGLFACFEALAARSLPKVGYWFAIGIAATYPFLARQATQIMSDHLHAFLLLAAITSLMVIESTWRRVLLFGFLFGAATFVRTYSIVIIPALFGWPILRRAFGASRRQWAVSAAICILPFVLWASRNAYWYGRFVPFSTAGLGASLYLNKLDAEIGESYGEVEANAIYKALSRDGEDFTNYAVDRALSREAIAWMTAHPGTVARQLVGRIPRLWISKGEMRHGISPAYPLFILYLGGLMVLGVLGMWLKRHDHRWRAVTLIVVLYWGFLLHTPAEARRTLPLRLPMLVFAGFAVDDGLRRWRERRKLAAPSRA
jgi:hypothetical protein